MINSNVNSNHTDDQKLFKQLRHFIADDTGWITIEFVTWMPVFAAMISFVVDSSFVFMTNSSMWDSARDAARRVAVHNLTVEEAEQYVRSNLFTTSQNFTIQATETPDEIVVTVVTPINDATALQLYSNLLQGDLVARVTMLKEPQ